MGRFSGAQIREQGSELDSDPGSLQDHDRPGCSAILQGPRCGMSECQLFSILKTLFTLPIPGSDWLAPLGSHVHFLAGGGWAGPLTDSLAYSRSGEGMPPNESGVLLPRERGMDTRQPKLTNGHSTHLPGCCED